MAPALNATADAAFKHPLDPLTPNELTTVTYSVRQYIATKTPIKAVKFIQCNLLPPPKRAVLAYLGIPLEPGAKPEERVPITRKAEADLFDVVEGTGYNFIVAFRNGQWEVEKMTELPQGTHPQITVQELISCEQVVKSSPLVHKVAAEIGITPEQIFCDGWAIGYDDRFPKQRRIQQALLFARFSQHDNLYAHPLDFIPIVDANAGEVLHIDFPPSYKAAKGSGKLELTAPSTAFPPLEKEPVNNSGRDRIPPPKRAYDFLPDLMEKTEPDGFELRKDVKPLHIIQPEGVSFKMDGNVLEWQNWKMHIAFANREGIVLSTCTYNDHGEVRPLFYRLALAEMVVPYGAPEYPHPRKHAFDSGEYGVGQMANQLSLGCDCVGQVHYLGGSYPAPDGSAIEVENVICIHEEDAGVLWKHTDFRPGGRSRTVRSRRLVISMVCTVANYEYIWNYRFYQDGSIEVEVGLTGILQIYVGADGEQSPYATTVAPNLNAHYHQHIFSYRLDPMIDGIKNTVIEADVEMLDAPTGSKDNFAGNGFHTKETRLATETGRQYDISKERRWRIVNPQRRHYSTGKEVGYSLGIKGGVISPMAKDDSWLMTRAPFVKNALWVCRDVEGEENGSERVYPAGKYVPQTRETPTDSIGNWVKGENPTDGEDILVYFTVGTTHIPRPEDWPVMPVDAFRVTLKPVSFFKVNPSLDVPGTQDHLSVPAQPTQNGHACHS
ncbi:hypothetical protein AGABI2DRAFT_196562 [Agaricus bisporus var. bisporus H97]|uniref:hypothetical protein n=1 Tax=Agaricus bisporus var. bisporus (strain H97 / ATCC MYA-4626 / FGSC 10389) TaxID=936046 RepID=UPI00029F7F7C|nr:hypothetical protein AGABI2DRAFT_196562 [Agaricus bisporus var. bisporus H97]EKV50980.1 hypothetical protein AGABI2DRAFT_196562 [Agaricus bisporus var. bisporus H97]